MIRRRSATNGEKSVQRIDGKPIRSRDSRSLPPSMTLQDPVPNRGRESRTGVEDVLDPMGSPKPDEISPNSVVSAELFPVRRPESSVSKQTVRPTRDTERDRSQRRVRKRLHGL